MPIGSNEKHRAVYRQYTRYNVDGKDLFSFGIEKGMKRAKMIGGIIKSASEEANPHISMCVKTKS